MEPQWNSWANRPYQKDGMSVEVYYHQFCDWRDEIDTEEYQCSEKSIIDDFIVRMSWDLLLRMYAYPSPPFSLSDAFRRAQFEESIISLEELTRKIRADKVFDEMPHPISIDTAEAQGDEDIPDNNVQDVLGVPGFADDNFQLHLKSNELHLNILNPWSESEIKQAYLEGNLTDEAKKDEQSKAYKLVSKEIIYPMTAQVIKPPITIAPLTCIGAQNNRWSILMEEGLYSYKLCLSRGKNLIDAESRGCKDGISLIDNDAFFLFDPGGWRIWSLNDRSYFIWEELSDNISWNCFYNHVSGFVMIILLSRRLALEDGLWYEVDRVSTGRWDPGYRIMYFYILEDKDVLKGNGIAVRLALKQDEGLNGAFAYYSAHMALSLIDQDYDGRRNNRAILRNVPDSLVVIRLEQSNYYGNDVEAAMLKGNPWNYSPQASSWILESDCPDDMLEAEECLTCAVHYLYSSIEIRLIVNVQHDFSTTQLFVNEYFVLHALLKVVRVGELSSMYRFSPTSWRTNQKQNEFLLQSEPNPKVVARILRPTYFDGSSLDTLNHELHGGEHMIYTNSLAKFSCYLFDPGGGSFFLITWNLEI